MTSDKQMSSSTQVWLRNREVERFRVFFRTGGTLEVGDPSYLVRAADEILYQAIQDGEYSYILTVRQMGKSSLMVQTAARLRGEGDTVVVIDLTALGSLVTSEQWYYSLAQCVGARLELEDEVDNYWDQNMGKTPLQRWLGVVTRIALPRCRQRRVIFVDEADY